MVVENKIFASSQDRQKAKKFACSEDIDIGINEIIMKPWGYEFIFYRDTSVAIWRLFIKENESTSFHCHLNKQTMMLVVKGAVKCHTFKKDFILEDFNSVVFDKGVFHSLMAVSTGGAEVIEVDYPACLGDVHRLEDKYGREGKEFFA